MWWSGPQKSPETQNRWPENGLQSITSQDFLDAAKKLSEKMTKLSLTKIPKFKKELDSFLKKLEGQDPKIQAEVKKIFAEKMKNLSGIKAMLKPLFWLIGIAAKLKQAPGTAVKKVVEEAKRGEEKKKTLEKNTQDFKNLSVANKIREIMKVNNLDKDMWQFLSWILVKSNLEKALNQNEKKAYLLLMNLEDPKNITELKVVFKEEKSTIEYKELKREQRQVVNKVLDFSMDRYIQSQKAYTKIQNQLKSKNLSPEQRKNLEKKLSTYKDAIEMGKKIIEREKKKAKENTEEINKALKNTTDEKEKQKLLKEKEETIKTKEKVDKKWEKYQETQKEFNEMNKQSLETEVGLQNYIKNQNRIQSLSKEDFIKVLNFFEWKKEKIDASFINPKYLTKYVLDENVSLKNLNYIGIWKINFSSDNFMKICEKFHKENREIFDRYVYLFIHTAMSVNISKDGMKGFLKKYITKKLSKNIENEIDVYLAMKSEFQNQQTFADFYIKKQKTKIYDFLKESKDLESQWREDILLWKEDNDRKKITRYWVDYYNKGYTAEREEIEQDIIEMINAWYYWEYNLFRTIKNPSRKLALVMWKQSLLVFGESTIPDKFFNDEKFIEEVFSSKTNKLSIENGALLKNRFLINNNSDAFLIFLKKRKKYKKWMSSKELLESFTEKGEDITIFTQILKDPVKNEENEKFRKELYDIVANENNNIMSGSVAVARRRDAIRNQSQYKNVEEEVNKQIKHDIKEKVSLEWKIEWKLKDFIEKTDFSLDANIKKLYKLVKENDSENFQETWNKILNAIRKNSKNAIEDAKNNFPKEDLQKLDEKFKTNGKIDERKIKEIYKSEFKAAREKARAGNKTLPNNFKEIFLRQFCKKYGAKLSVEGRSQFEKIVKNEKIINNIEAIWQLNEKELENFFNSNLSSAYDFDELVEMKQSGQLKINSQTGKLEFSNSPFQSFAQMTPGKIVGINTISGLENTNLTNYKVRLTETGAVDILDANKKKIMTTPRQDVESNIKYLDVLNQMHLGFLAPNMNQIKEKIEKITNKKLILENGKMLPFGKKIFVSVFTKILGVENTSQSSDAEDVLVNFKKNPKFSNEEIKQKLYNKKDSQWSTLYTQEGKFNAQVFENILIEMRDKKPEK